MTPRLCANLASSIVRAVINLAVNNDASADTGSHAQADEVPRAAAAAKPELGQGHCPDGILEEHGDAEPFLQGFYQGDVFPAGDMLVAQGDACIRVYDARDADSNPQHLAIVAGAYRLNGVLDL